MSPMNRFRTVFLCVALEMGALCGVPMRPEQIRELMHQMNQPTLAHALPAEDEGGDDGATARESTDINTRRTTWR